MSESVLATARGQWQRLAMPIPRQTQHAPPAGAWQAGWHIRASVWSGCEDRTGEVPLRTLANPGDLAPLASPPPWSFHLGLGALFGAPSVRYLANGVLFTFPQVDPDAYVDLLLVAPGLLVGYAKMRIEPSLFCPESEPVEHQDGVSVQTHGNAVVLRWKREEEATLFCLAISDKGLDAAQAAAEKGLGYDLAGSVEREVELRKAFWSHHRRAGQDQAALNHAFERLVHLLEPGTAAIPGLWTRTDSSEFSLRALHGLVRAWLDADAKVATDLVRTALKAIPGSGMLPGALHPDTGPQTSHSTWPLLSTCVWSLGKTGGGEAFIGESLPLLRNYLDWAVSYFDPKGRGTPAWQQAEESFSPEAFDEGLCSAGLSALLLCEIDRFFEMLDKHPEITLDTAQISLARERIEEHLLNALWDAEAGVFRDRYIGGEPVTRITLSGVLPLLWPGLEGQHRTALLRHLQEKGLLHKRSGWAAWQSWEDDTVPAPIRCEHQILLFDRVRELNHATVALLGPRIADNLKHALAERTTFPSSLAATRSRDAADEEDGFEVPGACLYILSSSPLLQKHSESVSKVATALERHRNAFAAGCFAALLLLLAGLAVREWRGGQLDDEAAAAAFGMTEQLIARRQFDQALDSLEALRGRADQKSIDFYEGLIHFHQGNFADAEQRFRSASEQGRREAESRMNVALSLFRQGKLAEATQAYEEVVQLFEARNPLMAQRARAAINIIRENQVTLSQSLGNP